MKFKEIIFVYHEIYNGTVWMFQSYGHFSSKKGALDTCLKYFVLAFVWQPWNWKVSETYFIKSSSISSTVLPTQPNSCHFSFSGTQMQSNFPKFVLKTFSRNLTRRYISCFCKREKIWFILDHFFFQSKLLLHQS